MKKALIVILVLAAALLVLQGCTTTNNDTQTAQPTADTTPAATDAPVADMEDDAEMTLTIEELAQYDGQNGNPAYIAVDGVIYDVTNVGPWSGGTHNGFTAGQDLTEEIKTVSPHGVSKLTGLTAVGKLAD